MTAPDPFAGQGGRYERDPVTGERRRVEPPTAPAAPIPDVPICAQALLDAQTHNGAADASGGTADAFHPTAPATESPNARRARRSAEPTPEPTE